MPTFTGTTGNDYLEGTTGSDTLIGLAGDDRYVVDDPSDVIVEGFLEGNDRVYTNISYTLPAGAEVEFLWARDIVFTTPLALTGNEFNNTIYGNQGNNILDGGAGSDSMFGYGGDDAYYVDSIGDRAIDSSSGNDIIYTSVSFYLGFSQGIETLAVRDAASLDALTLVGYNAAETIIGNAGNNYIDGGEGVDVLRGLGGNDTYVVRQAGDLVEETVGGGTDLVQATVSYTLAAGAEVETLAMRTNTGITTSTLVGNELVNRILGDDGANTLNGGGGADTLVGFNGDDTYFVDNLGDAVFEDAFKGHDTIRTSISWVLSGGLSVEILATADAQATTALSLIGNEFVNTIEGNAGNNFLDGGAEMDVMSGGLGNDIYAIDNVGDVVNEALDGGNDIVFTSISYALTANQSSDTLAARDNTATTAMDLTGNNLDNNVLGNAGANRLDGGAGNDTLAGYGGADTFAFTTAAAAGNFDTILDFLAGTDKLAFDDAVFSGIGTPGSLNANAFATGTAAADADDRLVYNSTTGQLFYDADGNGAGAAILVANLTGNPTLAASDFQVI